VKERFSEGRGKTKIKWRGRELTKPLKGRSIGMEKGQMVNSRGWEGSVFRGRKRKR